MKTCSTSTTAEGSRVSGISLSSDAAADVFFALGRQLRRDASLCREHLHVFTADEVEKFYRKPIRNLASVRRFLFAQAWPFTAGGAK